VVKIKKRVLDMSTQELGAPAYRKYDIEACKLKFVLFKIVYN
jgi:hypothetical protein